MQIRELSIPDAYEFSPVIHSDPRGAFFESYRFEPLAATVGHPLQLRQANISISARGVVRGVHYALVPPGQAKYVMAVRGAFLDYVVDLRVGSPTFGAWDSVHIDDVDHRAVYLSEGLGHVLVALSDQSTASYLASAVFDPVRELAIDPFDPDLALDLPFPRDELIVSDKDRDAPSLADALASGALPSWVECRAYVDSLAAGAL